MARRLLVPRRPLVPALLLVSTAIALADATIPKADKKGAQDSPLLKRYAGSFIVVYEKKSFAEFTLPLSKLEKVPDKKDRQNNHYYEPKSKKDLEGAYTRIIYVIPENRSPLEVLRNYQDEIRQQKGQILFECKGEECGGDPTRNSEGGGGDMSLAMYLYPYDRLTEQRFTTGHCVMSANMRDLRYTTAFLPDSGAHASILAYSLVAPGKHDGCLALNDRTIVIVDLLEAKAREQKMVTVSSGEMAQAISTGGRVALYGIYFDFNKADVKPESDPTIEQIAKLLKDTPSLKVLIVGHTDNVGTFPFNTDLSQRRAAAVVAVLTSRHGVAKERLSAVGVSYASPVASNKTEEGRAKNRRVELVENAPVSR
jgi:OOP family OmpA-OmpF porin